jgi:quercetin dioxygenase-like cupin family protein
MIIDDAAALAQYRQDKMGKADLVSGSHLFAGLNAFEAGQAHEPHAHCERDKLYVVLEGQGELTVGADTRTVGPGAVALAPADVVHALRNPGPERLLVLIVMAPPPAPKK